MFFCYMVPLKDRKASISFWKFLTTSRHISQIRINRNETRKSTKTRRKKLSELRHDRRYNQANNLAMK
jgi:hypothetical protein